MLQDVAMVSQQLSNPPSSGLKRQQNLNEKIKAFKRRCMNANLDVYMYKCRGCNNYMLSSD